MQVMPSVRELYRGHPAGSTRERLVQVALELFYSEGINEVGLSALLQAADVSKSTFYNYFESKDELLLAAVERYSEWESAAFLREVTERAAFDPQRMLPTIFDVLEDWFRDPAYRGCWFIRLTSERGRPDDAVGRVVAKHFREFCGRIEQMAAAAGAQDPGAVAERVTLLIMSSATSWLMTGSADAVRVAKDMAERLLLDQLPPAQALRSS